MAQQRKEKPWQKLGRTFSERLAKQPFITEEERRGRSRRPARGAKRLLHRGKAAVAGLGEAWLGQARRAREPLGGAAGEPAGRRGGHAFGGAAPSMAQAAPGGEPPAGPEQGAPGFALEGVDSGVPRRGVCGAGAGGAAAARAAEGGPGDRQSIAARRGYGTLKKRQDTESWRDAFLEQQAALQAQTLAQERAQAEGVGAAYTKYVRPLLERAALGLSTALSPIPSVPGSEPGTGLAQAIETSNANYERNKTHDISGRPVHGQGVDAAGEFAYGNSQMKDSGCGVIGTYNALYLLGKDPSLAEVGRRYEISGAMAGGGAWGTNPYGAPQVLKQYGVQYEEYTDPDALEREAGEGDVMIVSIWNRKGTIFEGYHTFAVQKVNGELMVYNRFNNSAESTEKKTMGEVIENGQFIVGYRVQNAK
ncbi:MAG: hypothetical protein ACLRZH_17370 [Ruthenibacterium lactatiformans]